MIHLSSQNSASDKNFSCSISQTIFLSCRSNNSGIIYAEGVISLEVIECSFVNCEREGNGSSIYVNGSTEESSLIVNKSIFENCLASGFVLFIYFSFFFFFLLFLFLCYL
jgi:hypothetical protein